MSEPPPALTEQYISDAAQVKKRLGPVTFQTCCTLLITPVDHNGHRYTRRCIHYRTTIYTDAHPIAPNDPAKC